MLQYSDKYLAIMGKWPKKIPHWEHWSCPDAETHLTGIDYYRHPQLCRLKMAELYPQLELEVPQDDTPKKKPGLDLGEHTTSLDESGGRHVRWGDAETSTWDFGKRFQDEEDVFAFSPLENADLTYLGVNEARDYRDEEKLYRTFRSDYPEEWGDRAPEGSTAFACFYNTMFMWPLLAFGWELFMETCLDERFGRIMDEFAEINRRVFRSFARLPVNFILCHDDIVTTRGPVCSPAWMHRYIFPRYEEFWGIVKAAGKEVLFMSDGCMDAYADDVIACGARGMITEPYTDFKSIAVKHNDILLAGEGDVRILYRNDPEEIKAMVGGMVETAKINGGYMMCIGNHIPWNVPPAAIKRYLDLSAGMACRG